MKKKKDQKSKPSDPGKTMEHFGDIPDYTIIDYWTKDPITKEKKRVLYREFPCGSCKYENHVEDIQAEEFQCEKCGETISRKCKAPDEGGLSDDWMTVTYKNSKILEHLVDIKPLEDVDLMWINRENETRLSMKKDKNLSDEDREKILGQLSPWVHQGLKRSKTNIAWWTDTFDWFPGARVSRGSMGGPKDPEGNKDDYCMIKISGKGMRYLREINSSLDWTDYEIIKFFFDHGGSFCRLDFAIDTLPKNNERGLIKNSERQLLEGTFGSRWKRDKTPPKVFKCFDYAEATDLNCPELGEIKDIKTAREVTECITLGSRSSDTFGRIYDKRRELIANGYVDPGVRWERFEIEVKKKRAQALAEEIVKAGRDKWKKKVVYGLFKDFMNFKNKSKLKGKRIKDVQETAPWYDELLQGASVKTLGIPKVEMKPREVYRPNSITRIGKSFLKVAIPDIEELGYVAIEKLIVELVTQGLEGMTAEDWRQMLWHTGRGEPERIKYSREELKEEKEQIIEENKLDDLIGIIEQLREVA